MNRTIHRFHQDDVGDWVAELGCGHDQHVRHRPPFEQRPWVLSAYERERHIGESRDCPLCEQGVLPARVVFLKSSSDWDEISMPAPLRNAHRLSDDKWGLLQVAEGSLRYVSHDAAFERVVAAGEQLAIPPGVAHDVTPIGAARFRIDFFRIAPASEAVAGGETAC